MASKPKPWEHLFQREGSAYWWVRFTVYDAQNRPRKVRRSTDETDSGEATKAALRIYREEMQTAGAKVRDDCPEPERIRKSIEDAVVEYVRDRLPLVAAQRDPQFRKRRENDLNLYVVPKSDDELATLRAKGAKVWQPVWRFCDEITDDNWEDAMPLLHRSNLETGRLRWASIRHLAWSLRDFVLFCKKRGWIESKLDKEGNPLPKIKPPTQENVLGDQQDRRALSVDERDKFLGHLREQAANAKIGPDKQREYREAHRHYVVMFRNLFRKSTVERLTRRWVKDWDRGVVVIPRSQYKVITPKPIRVVLHPESLACVKAQLAENEARREPGEPVNLDEPIFGRFDHKVMFWGVVQRLGLDPDALVAHHIGRHTAATLLAKAGATDREMMAAGGWKSPAMLARYAHLDEELAAQAMEKMP